MVHQSTSSSEYLFLSFSLGFCTYQLHHFQLQLIIFIITYQFHHYLLTVFSSLSSLKSSDIFHLVSESLAISYWFLDHVDAG